MAQCVLFCVMVGFTKGLDCIKDTRKDLRKEKNRAENERAIS